MNDRDRFRLLGAYRTPRVRLGSVVSCECRDCDVIVVGYSDGKVPWPVGRKRGAGSRGLILFADLTRAVRGESAQAVGHWWGVGRSTVANWRKALEVELANPGTHRLRSAYAHEPWAVRALRKAVEKARGSVARQKMAAARRGKPQPPHVGEAVARANRRRRVGASTRARMSATRRAIVSRGEYHYPNGRAWTAREDELIRKLPVAEAVRRTRRTLASVYSRRGVLGVADKRSARADPEG